MPRRAQGGEKANTKIIKPHLVLCEGADAYWFLVRFLNSAELLAVSPFYSQEIQVIDFGGNEELQQKLAVLKLSPGFSSVKTLLILRDAEKDAARGVSQIVRSLRSLQLPTPQQPGQWEGSERKVGFLLFPACDDTAVNGTLEDLCLSILKDQDSETMIEEVQALIGRLKKEYGRAFPHEHKAQLHTYFSVTDRYVGMKIGEAAMAQAFDWNSGKLRFLKEFLLSVQEMG